MLTAALLPPFTHSPLCTVRLHIHSSFSSYILLFKPLLILPRPVHPLTPLYLSPPCTFPLSIQNRGERHLSLTPYTPTLPAHKKKKLLVKFNYSRREQRHEYGGAYCCMYAFIYIYIYAHPLRFRSGDYLSQPD